MSTSKGTGTLSLQELETLIRERRERETARQVQRIARTERTLGPAVEPSPSPQEHMLRSPYTVGSLEHNERRLISLRYEPLSLKGIASAGDTETTSRRGRDIVLWVIELLAFVALLAIVGYGAVRLRALNEESRRLQQVRPQPTAVVSPTHQATPAVAAITPTGLPETATPSVTPLPQATQAAMLPGRHDPEQVTPLPANPQDVVTTTVEVQAPPTPASNVPTRLVIEKLGIDALIVQGDSAEDLKTGVGHRLGTANPGEPSNMVLSAHNDIYGEIFRDLNQLEPGDEVRVYSAAAVYRYIVNRVEIVQPTAVEVMDPTDHAIVTMISCYPYLLDTHRVVVVADLLE